MHAAAGGLCGRWARLSGCPMPDRSYRRGGPRQAAARTAPMSAPPGALLPRCKSGHRPGLRRPGARRLAPAGQPEPSEPPSRQVSASYQQAGRPASPARSCRDRTGSEQTSQQQKGARSHDRHAHRAVGICGLGSARSCSQQSVASRRVVLPTWSCVTQSQVCSCSIMGLSCMSLPCKPAGYKSFAGCPQRVAQMIRTRGDIRPLWSSSPSLVRAEWMVNCVVGCSQFLKV